ncbi:RNase adapter RapZ [Minwuia thermotolerans]|uniref:RNase adapter RapZ n=1 Tax=Minwuia thermotolerans TaxID=2056226 RepID=UPI0019D13166|nr:RNase adapter RapZ [Minwuia thermotolerans]
MNDGNGERIADSGRVLLVSGMSGAGKSSALKILEDMGWEVVDNLPLNLLERLLEAENVSADETPPLAVGIDTRTRGFDAGHLVDMLKTLRTGSRRSVELCFLDADPDVLQRRFTETRRRHPLAADRTVMDGIRMERRMLEVLRERTDEMIDTSEFALPDLRRVLGARYSPERPAGLQVFVTSFSYRHGLPRDADLVFDVRFLRNPHYVPALKPGTGLDEDVRAHIRADEAWEPFVEKTTDMLALLLPRYGSEGKSYLTIAFGCTGGRHRSVYAASLFGQRLRGLADHVTVRHRDLDRPGVIPSPA